MLLGGDRHTPWNEGIEESAIAHRIAGGQEGLRPGVPKQDSERSQEILETGLAPSQVGQKNEPGVRSGQVRSAQIPLEGSTVVDPAVEGDAMPGFRVREGLPLPYLLRRRPEVKVRQYVAWPGHDIGSVRAAVSEPLEDVRDDPLVSLPMRVGGERDDRAHWRPAGAASRSVPTPHMKP